MKKGKSKINKRIVSRIRIILKWPRMVRIRMIRRIFRVDKPGMRKRKKIKK